MKDVAAIGLVLAVAAAASAQDARIALPVTLRGDVHRIVRSGCGQAWTGDEARSTVGLTVDARGRARLTVDAHVHSESGGFSLLDRGGRYHGEHDTTRAIVWTGRARIDHGALVIRLHALTETVPVDGSPLTVTNRSTDEAVLRCVREPRDVLAAEPPDGGADAPMGRRSPFSCSFDPPESPPGAGRHEGVGSASPSTPAGTREHEGPLPRPVADLLTPPFLLDTGAGITTDASYEASVSREATSFVARAPRTAP